MSAEVVRFTGITSLPLDPDRLLREALGKLERVIIIGVDKDGEAYHASSDPDGGTFLWDVERAKHKLMTLADE